MPTSSRHSAWLAVPALILALLTGACASAPPPASPVEEEMPMAPAETPEEVPAHLPNTLRWTTASEVDNFGFDVYRSELEEGPFERMTERPISGAGTTDLTTNYSWEDTTNDAYTVYYYYVESISLQGVREQFTPIIRAKAKLTRDDE